MTNLFERYVDSLPTAADYDNLLALYRRAFKRHTKLAQENRRLQDELADAEDTRLLLALAGIVIGLEAALIVLLVALLLIHG